MKTSTYTINKRKCMNCGNYLSEAGGIYGKRFCSEACKDAYMGPRKDDLEMIKSV